VLPLEAVPFNLIMGFTFVKLPLDASATISLAASSLASISLPLDEDVCIDSAFPEIAILLPLEASQVIFSNSMATSILLPLLVF
jgi:hypothetical protein